MKQSLLIAGLAAGCAAILSAQDTPPYMQPQQQPPIVLQPASSGTDDPFVGDTPADVPQPPQPGEAMPSQPPADTMPPPPDTGIVAPQPSGRTYVGGLPTEGPPPAGQASEEPPPTDMPQPTYAPPPLPVQPVDAYQYFYEPLTPYGEWVSLPGYGYCWRPRGTPYGWRPYWDGHWVWSECGWMWVSDEPWGWATYHYGRWMLTSEFGWTWVPGRRWAPAWVCWRQGPDFVGWAPLPPGAPVGGGFYREAFGISIGCWTMVFERDFLSPHCRRVAFPVHRHHEFLPRATRVINVSHFNTHIVNVGPGRRHIERAAGHTVPTLRVRSTEVTRTGSRVTTRVHSDDIVVHRPGRAIMAKPADTTHIKRAEKVTVVRTPITDVPARATTTRTGRTGGHPSDTTTHGATKRSTTQVEVVKGKPAKVGTLPPTTTRTVESPKGISTSRDTRRRGDQPSTTIVQPEPPARAKFVAPPPATTTTPLTTAPSTARSKDTKSRGRHDGDGSPTLRTPPPPARTYTPKQTTQPVAPATITAPPSTYQRKEPTTRTRQFNDSGPKVTTPTPPARTYTPKQTTQPVAPATITAPPSTYQRKDPTTRTRQFNDSGPKVTTPTPPARTYTPPQRPQYQERLRAAPTTPRVTAPPAPATTTTAAPSASGSRGRKSKSDDQNQPR